MRIDSFWPLRHGLDRLASEAYRRRHSDAPWLPRQAIALLDEMLRPADHCLDWGAGSSTAWLRRRTARVIAVEHDQDWFGRVQAELAANGLDPGSVRLLSSEPSDRPSESPYVRVIDEFEAGQLHVCLIDGMHRERCALEAVAKLAPGGVLLLDDAHGCLDHPTRSPHSRFGQGPLNADWKRFAELVSSWRRLWISDGYSDAAIWLKP